MTDIVAALSDLLEHRTRVAGELAGLDHDIEEMRRLLGVPVGLARILEPPPASSVDVQPRTEEGAGDRPRAGLRQDLLDPAESVRAAAKRTGVTRKTVRRQRARAAAGETASRPSAPSAEERLLDALGRLGPCTRRVAAIEAKVGLWAVVDHLTKLRRAGRVVCEGRGRAALWRIACTKATSVSTAATSRRQPTRSDDERERIWFSPHCLPAEVASLFSGERTA